MVYIESMEIQVLDFQTMPHSLLESYAKLQRPVMVSEPKPIDLFNPINRSLYAIGAAQNGIPVGLMLMSIAPSVKAVEVKSIYVAEPYRRNKIGSRMVKFAAEQLKSVDYKLILAIYPDRREDTPMIEAFLQSCGFMGRQMAYAEFIFEYSGFKPDWFKREYAWPGGLNVFPWTELTYYEFLKINERYSAGEFPQAVYPFQGDGSFEPMNSLGLRHEERLIGWMITERISEKIINYGNLYIDYEYQHKGYSIQLLVDALNIHYRRQIKWGMFKVNVLQASGKWLLFIRRRLAPHADQIREYYQTRLIL